MKEAVEKAEATERLVNEDFERPSGSLQDISEFRSKPFQ
jgi:hypothetical protein